jgi:hypothetical protein
MIARIVRRNVLECERRPIRISMTGRAVALRRHMRRQFTGGARTVMADRTLILQRRMIQLGGLPRQRAMTRIANLFCRDMSQRLADSVHAVVTAVASVRRERIVIETRGRPCVRRVASFASGAALNMSRQFPRSDRTAMAASARAAHLRVIDA